MPRPGCESAAGCWTHHSVPQAVPPDTRPAVSLLQSPPTLDGFHQVMWQLKSRCAQHHVEDRVRRVGCGVTGGGRKQPHLERGWRPPPRPPAMQILLPHGAGGEIANPSHGHSCVLILSWPTCMRVKMFQSWPQGL